MHSDFDSRGRAVRRFDVGMTRPRRHYDAALPVHVIGRGVHGDRLCPSFSFGALLWNDIGTWCRRSDIDVLALCVMGNHYHLLAIGSPDAFSLALHRAHSRLANIRNKSEGRRGRVFGRRYRTFSIKDDVHFARVVPYVALNPVRHRLCHHPRDWHHSTYATLTGDRPPPAWFDRERALRLSGFTDGDAFRRAISRSWRLPAPPMSAGAMTRHHVHLHKRAGATTAAIAADLHIDERHVRRILEKTGEPRSAH